MRTKWKTSFTEVTKRRLWVHVILICAFGYAWSFNALADSRQSSALHSASNLLEYRDAARYTHLVWHPQSQQVAVTLKPLRNHSGLPDRHGSDDPNAEMSSDYYEHGRLPAELNQWLTNNLLMSGFFNLREGADYSLEFTLQHVTLPLPWAPDDVWWQKLHDQVDRWGKQRKNARVTLALTIIPASERALSWMRQPRRFDVDVALSNCDLNATPQPLLPRFNNHHNMQNYAHSMSGQAFIAASNYLLWQVADYLQQRPEWAEVIAKQGNLLLLESEHGHFEADSKLQLFYQSNPTPDADGAIQQLQYRNSNWTVGSQPAGELHIDQLMGKRALAWPVNLRPDHIRIGDRVMMQKNRIETPAPIASWHFEPATTCVRVESSVAVN